jgi:uncharacterized protein YbaP (TraB family)
MDAVSDADYASALPLVLSRSADERNRDFANLYAAWLGGQAKAVWDVLSATPLAQFPSLRQAAFVSRNALWLPRIVDVMGSPKRIVMYVGAGHMGGPEGLLSLLARSGHEVTSLLAN